eukprot:356197-Chlamydomonas_euryale.AAC.1
MTFKTVDPRSPSNCPITAVAVAVLGREGVRRTGVHRLGQLLQSQRAKPVQHPSGFFRFALQGS